MVAMRQFTRMVGVFHVVCHECAFEGLYERHATAVSERDEHARACDHRMTLLEIDRSKPLSRA